MKLYDGGRAPNPRRVQIFLAEKEIELPTVQLDLNALEQREGEFAERNPMMTVPVLELDDGTWISETIAICRYVEGVHPEPNLMGGSAQELATIDMWQRRAELSFFWCVGQAFRHLHPGGAVLEGVQIEKWGKINQQRAIKFLQILERELETRDYIANDRFTIADITAFCAYEFMKPARIEPPKDLIRVQQWFERMKERPSTKFRLNNNA